MSRTTLLALLAVLVSGSASDPVTGPAGVYSVTTTGPTRVTSGAGWVKIEWDVEPSVPPPPPPGPAVTPPPVVTPEKPIVVPPVVTTPGTPPPVLKGQVFLLAVYDKTKLSDLTPAQRQMLYRPDDGSAWIGTSLAKLQISWQPKDIHDEVMSASAAISDPEKPNEITTWGGEANRQGLPCVIAIGQDGQKVTFWTGPLPADDAAVIELGKKITGKQRQ